MTPPKGVYETVATTDSGLAGTGHTLSHDPLSRPSSFHSSSTKVDSSDQDSDSDLDLDLDDDAGLKTWHTTTTLEPGLQRHRRHQRRRRPRWVSAKRLRTCQSIANTILLFVGVVVSAVLLLRETWAGYAAATWQVGGDWTGQGPRFPTRVAKWEADERFVPANASEWLEERTVEQWKTLMPKSAGWPSPDTPFATTSMTHQLHCLYMMGRMFAATATPSYSTDKLPADYMSHYFHCVDYLRQAVMCAGDVALEPHTPADADDNGPLDGGWNGMHVCKDYGQVVGYLEQQIGEGVRAVLPVDD